MTSVDQKRARALELHLAGATYDAIADAVGYAGRSGAYKAVQDALSDLGAPPDDDAMATELARLDAMLTGLWPKARRGDVASIDRVLKISERRSLILASQNRATSIEDAETKETGLSEFEQRLRDRQSKAAVVRSAAT